MRSMLCIVFMSWFLIMRTVLPFSLLFHVRILLWAAVPGIHLTKMTVLCSSLLWIVSIPSVGCTPLMGMYSVTVGSYGFVVVSICLSWLTSWYVDGRLNLALAATAVYGNGLSCMICCGMGTVVLSW